MTTGRLFDQERTLKVFNSYAEILRASEDLGLLKLLKLSLELYELVPGVLRNTTFLLRGMYMANIHRCLNGASSAAVTGYVRIKDAFVDLQQLSKLDAETFRELLGFTGCVRLQRVEAGKCTSAVGRVWLRCSWRPTTKRISDPTASRIWSSRQMVVGLVCFGIGVSVRGWRASTHYVFLLGRRGRPALRIHQAKQRSQTRERVKARKVRTSHSMGSSGWMAHVLLVDDFTVLNTCLALSRANGDVVGDKKGCASESVYV